MGCIFGGGVVERVGIERVGGCKRVLGVLGFEKVSGEGRDQEWGDIHIASWVGRGPQVAGVTN